MRDATPTGSVDKAAHDVYRLVHNYFQDLPVSSTP
jgi:hypothetical protein